MLNIDQGNQNIIYGINTVIRAIKLGSKYINYVLIKQNFRNTRIRDIIYLSNRCRIPIKYIDSKIINSIVLNQKHQDVLCFLKVIPFYKTINLLPFYKKKSSLLVLVLDNILDIKNFGAIIRSSFFFGVSFIIIPVYGNMKINMDIIKTSAGYVFKVPICRENNIIHVIKVLRSYGFTILYTSEKSNYSVYDCKFDSYTAIILGNESQGVSNELKSVTDGNFKIPSFINNSYIIKKHLSLNVSVACGIILYEIRRQINI